MKKNVERFLVVILSLSLLCGLVGCNTSEREISSGVSDSTDGAPEMSDPAQPEQPEQPKKLLGRVSVEGTKFMVGGKELWINGTNTPWQHWNDFTDGMDEEFWDTEFERLVADGVNCTRIWLNCNGESIVRLTDDGKVRNINETHWEALDKLFDLADKHGIYIMPTLLSFDHFKEPVKSGQRWQGLIQSQEYSDRFAEKYVKDFCDRYRDRNCIFAVDVMNEPDWVFENAECGKIPWDNISYLLGRCAAVIHENSDFLVTVGVAMIKYNSEKFEGNKVSDEYLKELTGSENAYLDFYSTHYYNWMKSSFGFPCDKSPSEFGLAEEKPCIIGETDGDDEEKIGMTLTEKYKSVYDNGWNGIMVWLQPEDGENVWSGYDLTKPAVQAMAELISEKVFPLEGFPREGAEG